jgi:hypothetical protein
MSKDIPEGRHLSSQAGRDFLSFEALSVPPDAFVCRHNSINLTDSGHLNEKFFDTF